MSTMEQQLNSESKEDSAVEIVNSPSTNKTGLVISYL